jgi:hypothetical protein
LPNEKDWVDLIGDKPTRILLDELRPYFRNAITQNVGSGPFADVTTSAVSNFFPRRSSCMAAAPP